MQLWNPQLLRRFVDAALAGRAGQPLGHLAVAYILIALGYRVLLTAGKYAGENVGQTATNLLRDDLTLHCLKLDLTFHKTHPAGEMIERLDGDVSLLSNFFSQFLVGVTSNSLLVAGILAMLFREDWRVGLGMSAFTAVALVVLLHVRKRGVPRWAAVRQKSAAFYAFLNERMAGTEDICSCGAGPYVMRRFDEALREWYPLQRRAKMASYSLWTSSLLMFGVGSALALTCGALLYTAGKASAGTVFLIFNYVTLLESPIEQIRTQLQDLQSAGAAILRIDDLFGIPCPAGTKHPVRWPDRALSAAFRDVSFAYDDGEPVLNAVNFELRSGRVLGLLGHTGSGKTTLARLLMRFCDPVQGTVEVGGVPTSSVDLAELRRRVGFVTQDVQLFGAPLRDNLTFFDPSVSDRDVWHAIEQIGLAGWCRSLPDGLDTVIGAGGIGLSAGQAQLLAMARVFLADPGLVILDEASSRIDPATERMIERAVDGLLRGRTGIVIAHRLATVERADEILILEDGRVVEYGDREQLALDPSSRFRRLLLTGMEDVLA